MNSNVWFSSELKGVVDKDIGRNRDRILAICGEEEGIVLISLKEKEVQDILNIASRNVSITHYNTAQIKDTSIIIDVVSIKSVEGR